VDAMLPSRLGKLRILCSLPLFSDAICLKRQSAAEYAFTQVLLTVALATQLPLGVEKECELIELSIFAELPKAYLGDPSFYLRQRHPEVQQMYSEVRGRLWQETESTVGVTTTRCPQLYGVHDLVGAYAAMLFIEKECLLGNSYFFGERYRTHYHGMRQKVLTGQNLEKSHPAISSTDKHTEKLAPAVDWNHAIQFLDGLSDEATRARLEGGIAEYSSTFLGMVEKLKEHYRYKGWSYLFQESVGEHTFQVVFFARLLASKLNLSPQKRVDLYRLATLHDLAESYASDVVYPVKTRERDLGAMHKKIEDKIIEQICTRFNFELSTDPDLAALVDICDRFSAQLYFDREIRSGNTHFNVPNVSMVHTREKYQAKFPEVFTFLDELWTEYLACFKA
jgi:hypothetical protein